MQNPAIETYSIGVDELDNKKKYIRTSRTIEPMSIAEDDEIIYSHDVLADIVLNGDKSTSSKIVTEVDEKLGKSVMSEFYLKERKSKRRTLLLSRKTIVRAGQKIAKAIVENAVDMSVKKEDVEDFIQSIKLTRG